MECNIGMTWREQKEMWYHLDYSYSTFAVHATAAETVIRDSSCDVYHIWVGNYCTWMVKIAVEYSELGAVSFSQQTKRFELWILNLHR